MRYYYIISYVTVIGALNVTRRNVASFTPLDQQLLRFSPLDHVTEMTCHLFKMVQFDFEKGNLRSGLIELLSSFAIAT